MVSSRKKNIFAVRCHEFGEKERELYAYGEQYFGEENTFLIMNVENKPKIPKGFNCVHFNHEILLSSKDFLWFREVAWKCGDYCYYALNKKHPGYEYLWLVEPDLKICEPDPNAFFSVFEGYDHDWLAPFLGPASEKLYFYHTAKCLEATPMSCLFPITRVKVSKISQMENVRKKLTQDFLQKNRPPHDYPNDEIFFATVSRRLGLKCAGLDKLSTFNFMLFRSDKDTMFLDDDVREVKGRFIMHPVLEEEEYVRKKERIFAGVLKGSGELVHWVNDTLQKQPNPRLRQKLQERFLEEAKKMLRIQDHG
ncbi:hypothetical protein N9U60_03940 [Betaproteobacteria bacterium]|nr:hypothetical protein [Betaproteobacteria bacterium]